MQTSPGHPEHLPEPAVDNFLREPFSFAVQYQADEVNEASWLIYREEQGGKTIMGIFCCVFAICVAVTMILAFAAGRNGASQSMMTIVLCLVSALLSFSIARLAWQFLKKRAMSTFEKDPRYKTPAIYVLGSQGFQLQIGSATTLVSWHKVAASYDVPLSLCLISDGLIFPIPKRCFASEEQLKTVRRLIINNGVTYNRAGKRRDESKIEYRPPPMTLDIEFDVPGQIELEKIRYTVPEFTTGTATFKHPDSTLISEPLIFRDDSQSLQLECVFTMNELKAVDRVVFLKYSLAQLGLMYIALFLYITLVPSAMVAIFGLEYGYRVLLVLFQWAPLLLPVFAIHTLSVLERRSESLRETLALDQPILLELSENSCVKRSRRSVFAYSWAHFIACLETPEHYICTLKVGAVVIPKRLLDNRIKTAFVDNLLHRKIQKYENMS